MNTFQDAARAIASRLAGPLVAAGVLSGCVVERVPVYTYPPVAVEPRYSVRPLPPPPPPVLVVPRPYYAWRRYGYPCGPYGGWCR